jgi:uncharacterized protein (TIGR00299 family) protein
VSPRRVLYWDLVGGAAGDMLLASLIDAGASLERVRHTVLGLGLGHVEIHTKEARPAGLRARQIDVIIRGALADREYLPEEAAREAEAHALRVTGRAPDARPGRAPAHGHTHDGHTHTHDGHTHTHDGHTHTHVGHTHTHVGHTHTHDGHSAHRPYRDIRAMLERAELPARTRTLALTAFRHLAEAEALAHGVDVEHVEFHEVGADDAIADIVGVACALEELAPDEVIVSPVPIARGLTRGGHGPIPLPGPATLHILTGVPLAETPLRGELVTPTGAALLRAAATRFGAIPSMIIEHVGVGAGHKSWPDRPNVVRALIGRLTSSEVWQTDHECVVEANVDDMPPQHFAELERALFALGAADVWLTPIHMKKGRPAVTVSALVARELLDAATHAYFTHSTTLGVRVTRVERRRAAREMVEVPTPYGAVRVKRAPSAEGRARLMPEHDDCAARAEAHGVALRVVWEAALAAALQAESEARVTTAEGEAPASAASSSACVPEVPPT